MKMALLVSLAHGSIHSLIAAIVTHRIDRFLRVEAIIVLQIPDQKRGGFRSFRV